MDIDKIFSSVKKPAAKAGTTGKSGQSKPEIALKNKIKPKRTEGDAGPSNEEKRAAKLDVGRVGKKISKHTSSAEPDPRRKTTNDGYKIYRESELRLGRGGDTKDCPFDCNCCF